MGDGANGRGGDGGIKDAAERESADLLIAPTPHTIFAAPTTIPSVTASANATTQPARDAADDAAKGKQLTGSLTSQNLSQFLPQVLSAWDTVVGDISRFAAAAGRAVDQAIANDHAVAARNQELADARNAVLAREQQLADAAKLQAQLQKQITNLKSDEAKANAAAIRKVCVGAIAGGGVAMIGAALLLVYVTPKQVGLLVLLGGAIAISLGFAGLKHGEAIADIGLAVIAVTILGGIGAAIFFLRGDGISIAEGVQHAITASVINLPAAAPYFSIAQTVGAGKISGSGQA